MKPNLSVTITDRTLSQRLTLDGIRLEIDRYSFAVNSGPKSCTLRAYGDEKALRNLFNALRGECQILDGGAEPVWFGCVWSVVIHNGAVKYGRTLDGMATSVNIVYLLQSINQTYSGAGAQATTGFSSDSAAVAEFGTIQKRIRGSNGSDTAATARQARELSNRKSPQRILGTGEPGGEVYAEIICKGWFETLDWRYYTNTSGNAAGFEGNTVVTATANQFLGRAHPAFTGIAFTGTTHITNTPAYWAIGTASPYNYIYFTGSASNSNIAWQVASQIGAGSEYTITPGTVTVAAAGSAITTWDVGQKIYQAFTVTTPFSVAAVDVQIAKFGVPTDNIVVGVYNDSSGTPTTLLTSGTILNTDIANYAAWTTAVMGTAAALAAGTYGVQLSRSGSASLDTYMVTVDTGLNYTSGAMKLHAGATLGWLARPTNADLVFKVAGIVETTTQISNVITGVGEFVTASDIENTAGLLTVPYQDGTLTAKQVILNLLDYGTSDGYRLLCRVDINRRLIVFKEPDYATSLDVILGEDGIPRRVDMSAISNHKCPYGIWLKFEPLEFLSNVDKYLFVDEAEYNYGNDTWRVVRVKDRASDLALTRFEQ